MKMSSHPSPRARRAFTLVEMLTVIGIIAILAALLLPAIVNSTTKAKSRRAEQEIRLLHQAIESYYAAYSRYPVSTAAMVAASTNNLNEDFTYGTIGVANYSAATSGGDINNSGANLSYNANNSEVIAILMDMEKYPNGTWTVNKAHARNPQQTKFLSAKLSGDNSSPGVGIDGVYRDPWGQPYIISLDLNYDDKCWDAVYRLRNVSQRAASNPAGLYSLFNSYPADLLGNGNHYQFNGGVMVWSLGPDKKFTTAKNSDLGFTSGPYGSAESPPNKDNVLSWK